MKELIKKIKNKSAGIQSFLKKALLKVDFEKLKRVWKVIYWSVILVVLVITASTAFSVYETPGGYRMFVVLSGSMEPEIKIGSVVLVSKQNSYNVNDVITFTRSPSEGLKNIKSTTTHRIVELLEIEGGTRYRTKGDANEDPDLELVPKNQVLGKAVFQIPFLGKALAFTKTQLGFTLLIVIPGTILIYNEILNIKNEVAKSFVKRKPKTRGKKVEVSNEK